MFIQTQALKKILALKKRLRIIQGGCLAKGTRVLMWDLSYKSVEDVLVGDLLMGPDGKERKVSTLCRGRSTMYRVKQAKGNDYVVNDKHILVLEDQGKDTRRNVKEDGRWKRKYKGRASLPGFHKFEAEVFFGGSNRSTARRYKGIKAGLDFPTRTVLLDPYYLGLWLGDGNSRSAAITNVDDEVLSYLYEEIPTIYDVFVGKVDAVTTKIIKKNGKCNEIIQALKHYNLLLNKHIPKDFIRNNRKTRLQVLAGLLDSDGSLVIDSKTRISKGYYITQKRKQLAEDILLLCRTLGYYATLREKVARMKRKDGTIYECLVYNVGIFAQDYNEIPVKIKRKKCSVKNKRDVLRSSISLEKLPEDDYFGFELDGDHLFLLEDFTITHNTAAGKTVAVLLLFIDRAQSSPGNLASVVSETLPHLKRGAIRDFLNIMEEHGYYKDERWNKTELIYTFETGSKIEFFSADQPAKVRGPRRNDLFLNECNNISYETYTQLAIRTDGDIYLDYNPVSSFWVHEDLIPKHDHDFIKLTYVDNEALSPAIIQEIEARKDNKYFWQVYGLGEIGEIEGKIYNGWATIDEIPHEARLERYGIDFGYTNDPTAIVAIYYLNGGYIWDEICYEKGLSNKQIADVVKGQPEKSLVVADSAEPKSIDEIRSFGITILPADKGADSVRAGIQVVQSQKISVTKRSINTIKEYRNYLWKADRDGRVLNEPSDIWNHAMDAGRYGMVSIVPIKRREPAKYIDPFEARMLQDLKKNPAR